MSSSEILKVTTVNETNCLIGQQTDNAYRENTCHDLGGFDKAPHRPDDMANTGICSDDFGDNQISPAPAECDPQIIHHVWQHRREHDIFHDFAWFRAQG